jgi:hypothetical protein
LPGVCSARVLWDELHRKAFAAAFAVLGIKVHASGGILENKPFLPGFAWQSPVTALLKTLQFELQYDQEVAIIRWHSFSAQPVKDHPTFLYRHPHDIQPRLCDLFNEDLKIRIDCLASG